MQSSTVNPIDQLAGALSSELGLDPRGKRVPDLLRQYADEYEDWRDFAHFAEDAYTRNLVVRNELFDLIVLCWGAGQETPIHAHAGQRCWMVVMEGVVEEARFQANPEGAPVPGPVSSCKQGDLAYITDDIGLHVIRSANDQPAVSMHLYSLPFDECDIHDRETGEVSRKALGFHSKFGELI